MICQPDSVDNEDLQYFACETEESYAEPEISPEYYFVPNFPFYCTSLPNQCVKESVS